MSNSPSARTAGAIALALCLALPVPAPAAAFRFVTTCDSQGPSEANPDPPAAFDYVVGRINALVPRPDFWIFGGDAYYSAADSADAMVRWQVWKDRAGPLSDITVYPAIGNHDANIYDHDFDGAGPFRAAWPDLPQNGPAGQVGTVYSFRYQDGIFCVVNTNIYSPSSYSARFKVDATQRGWLAAVLDSTTALHRFVVGHAEAWPPSNSSYSSLQWNAAARDSFWQVMASRGVQAYICGHIHLWNMDYFVSSGYGNPPAETSVRQVVCGGAGGSLVSGYGGNFYHFVVWDIDGSSVSARVVDSYGNLRDSLKYTVPTGVSGPGTEATKVSTSARNIRLVSGRIRWDGYSGPGNADIYDVVGRRIWGGSFDGSSVSLGARLSSGLYLVRIAPRVEGAAAAGKILVIR